MGTEDDDELGGCGMAAVLLVLLVPVLLVLLLVAGGSWLRERDLRDLSALDTTTARVVDVDEGGRYLRDTYEVAFTPERGPAVRREVPVDSAVGAESEVRVAYDPDDPSRVRTVEDWEPLYEHLTLITVIMLVTAPLVVAWAAAARLWRRLRPR